MRSDWKKVSLQSDGKIYHEKFEMKFFKMVFTIFASLYKNKKNHLKPYNNEKKRSFWHWL